MKNWIVLLVLVAGLWPAAAGAQPAELPSGTPLIKSTPDLLGACFAPVPEVLYSHLPALSKGQGLLIETVGKNTVADRIGLRRHDVVIGYGSNLVKDVKHLSGLVTATTPGQTAKFLVFRSGKLMTLKYIVQPTDLPTMSQIKPSGPPAVNLEVDPLGNDRMKITFTYYAGGSSKLQTFMCEGTVAEIETQLKQVNQQQQIPGQVQELINVAVDRLRALKMR